MATSPPGKPQHAEEGRRKRQRTSFADEISLNPTTIAKSAGGKGTHSYGQTLYLLGLRTEMKLVKAPEVDGPQPTRYVSDCNPGLIAKELSSWYRRISPNEATLLHKLCQFLFIDRPSSGSEGLEMFFEFTGPFKSHDLQELLRSDKNIKYPFAKRPLVQEEMSGFLQTPAENDLRTRTDFVFGCDWNELGEGVVERMLLTKESSIAGLSSVSRSCAVAIGVEVKSSDTAASNREAKHQWSSLAYLNLLERVRVVRKKPYSGDTNMCQFGYLICGLTVQVWRMKIESVRSERRKSDVYDNYFTFPINSVGRYDLTKEKQVREFMEIHTRLLKWAWLVYAKEYITDIQALESASEEKDISAWSTTWQKAVEQC